jgi:hypothetical protein
LDTKINRWKRLRPIPDKRVRNLREHWDGYIGTARAEDGRRLNDGATVWVAEAIATPSLIWEQYSQLYPQGFRFKCTTNMNNYNRYWLKFNFTLKSCL